MSGPFRLTPPDARGGLVLRPSVHQQLAGRFDRRVTVVAAGPGFGKSTALVQMLTEHRLAPIGVDCWLTCEAGDHSPLNLAAGIAQALGSDPKTLDEGLVDSLIEAFAARAPADVCLVLDDVHLIGDSTLNSDGVSLLDDLVERLPANAHIVLAGRTVPPIRLSRLTAAGECVMIREEQLRLTDGQIVELARASGAAAQDFSGLAGWPALVALALGQGRPIDFVDEEILRGLNEQEKHLLLGLVAAGEADAGMLVAVTGVDNDSLLERIPLVDRRGNRFAAHALWTDILGDNPQVAEMRLQCAHHLIEEGYFEEAVELCLRSSSTHDNKEWATLVDGALVAALGIVRTPSGPTLRDWSERLPADASKRAPGLLLAGLVVRLDNPSDRECRSLLERSVTLFREARNLRGEAAALSALTYPLHVHRDSPGLSATYSRLVELADAGVGEAEHQRQLALGVLATATGQLDQVEAHVRPLLDDMSGTAARGVALWLHFNALNGLGEVATQAADELAQSDVHLPGFAVAALSAKWRAGELRSILHDPPPEPTGLRDRFLHAVWMTFVAVATGDTVKTDHYLSLVRSGSGEASALMADGSDVLPEVAVAAERGEIDRAAALLGDMIARHPLDGPSQPYYVMSVGLVYPLIPEVRDRLDELQLGSLFERDVRLNKALVSLVEHNDSTSLGSLELPEHAEEMLPALGLRRTGELLAAAWAMQHPRAQELVAGLVEMLGEASRNTFKTAAENANTIIASGARSIKATIPIQPAQTVDLRLLGSTELYINGQFVDSPEWRRHHVRSLLAFLVLNRRATREQIVAALWPAAGPETGRRNLRSTLNRLNSVLEPARGAGAAPFYIRSTGPRVQLVADDSFALDLEDFGHCSDEAHRLESAGTPSLAIEPYLASLEAYRGDLLPESYDDWVLVARDRLRAKYVANAVRCADLLVVSGRPHEATAVISSVVETEPWSEPAHRALVAAHLAAGDTAAARRAMTTCEALLDDIGGPAQEATLMLRRRLSSAPTS